MKADKKKASMIFKNIADDGHINAMYAYFIMLFKGDGIEINKEKQLIISKWQQTKVILMQLYIR